MFWYLKKKTTELAIVLAHVQLAVFVHTYRFSSALIMARPCDKNTNIKEKNTYLLYLANIVILQSNI